MAAYDSIYFTCPRCKASLEAQSSIGECLQTEFKEDAVPHVIAADILGNKLRCENCERSYVIVLRPTPQDRVAMDLVRDDDHTREVREAKRARERRGEGLYDDED